MIMNKVSNIEKIRSERRKEYIDLIGSYSEIERIVYVIMFYGAPTVSKVKPSSLICFKNNGVASLKDIWEKNKGYITQETNLEYYELNETEDCTFVLFYNKEQLEDILFNRDNKEYLMSNGYSNYKNCKEALKVLSENYDGCCPDEIGIFLGYPLSDVRAFRSEEKHNSKVVGYWRVYSKVTEALNTFKMYDDAKANVTSLLNSGKSPVTPLHAMC